MENFVTCQKRMRAVDGKQEIYLEWPKIFIIMLQKIVAIDSDIMIMPAS